MICKSLADSTRAAKSHKLQFGMHTSQLVQSLLHCLWGKKNKTHSSEFKQYKRGFRRSVHTSLAGITGMPKIYIMSKVFYLGQQGRRGY